MKNAELISIPADAPRFELHDKLHLTATECSFNRTPANVAVPFVHTHKQNEELYLIVEGSGQFYLDGEIIEIKAGDAVRVDPPCERCLKAGPEGIAYYCIQAKAGSLEQFTMTDAAVPATKAFN